MSDRIQEAREVLQLLGLPKEQTNERAALTLLGLLTLDPATSWAEATNPLIGITPLMQFAADRYLEQPYAPNTRETFRFTPGGHVLYVGDASHGEPVDHRAVLVEHGIVNHEHGKMPDAIVLLPDRGWLVLIEAVTTHGPIGPLRRADLA